MSKEEVVSNIANIELPTDNGLKLLAPNKSTDKVTKIINYVKEIASVKSFEFSL